ncbi:hypothetical protein X777_13715 [Ooceraea biroi]|uniref:Uncharacterized protein n=1 Tax=Ooceraea biroi TaxID=2015173 RepID=A0A026VX86_OOCBI|nr:hypothetical protein X777_13715 [Ooceraea biroi]
MGYQQLAVAALFCVEFHTSPSATHRDWTHNPEDSSLGFDEAPSYPRVHFPRRRKSPARSQEIPLARHCSPNSASQLATGVPRSPQPGALPWLPHRPHRRR